MVRTGDSDDDRKEAITDRTDVTTADDGEKDPFTDGDVDDSDETGLSLGRRDYLRAAAGTATALATTGLSGVAGAQSYTNEVNMVDAGADNTGSEPIDDVFYDNLADDTKLIFDEGEYLIDDLSVDGYSNVALVAPDGARLVPPDGVGTSLWLTVEMVEDFRFEGFVLDNTGDGAAPAHIFNVTGGTNLIKDVTVEGYRPDREQCFRPWCEGADTKLTLENVRMPDGNFDGAAFYVPEQYLYKTDQGPGTLVFRECYIENFSQGVYASGHGGPLKFFGGEYANCGINQIRVGGGNTRECVIKGVTIRVDGPAEPIEEKPNMRGIWLREGEGTVIEDCDIFMVDAGASYTAAGILIRGYHGDATIRNTRIRVDENVPGIKARDPNGFDSGDIQGMSELPDDWDITVENVSITGSADDGEAIQLYDRDGSTIENCCIHQTGSSRDGVSVANSSSCSVSNTTIDVTGEAVTSSGSSIDTTSITKSGSCPAPTAGGSGTYKPNSVSISGNGSEADYSFSVSGGLEKSDEGDATIDDADVVDGSSATGTVTNGTDAYGFDGEITGFETTGDPTVTINGREVDPADLPLSTLRVSGDGTTTTYSFEVGSFVRKSEIDGATINDGDSIDGTSVSGLTTNEADAYRFAGGVSSFQSDGDPIVEIDGSEVDESTLGSSDSGSDGSTDDGTDSGSDGSTDGGDSGSSSHTIWISGDGTTTAYSFTVSDTGVEKVTAEGATINGYDAIDGTSVSGITTSEADAYSYSGSVESFQTDGDPVVKIDGSEVDESTLGSSDSGSDGSTDSGSDGSTDSGNDGSTDDGSTDSGSDGSTDSGSDSGSDGETHTVWISGDGTTTTYSFTVSESGVTKVTTDGATVNGFDSIDGTSVSGITTNEPDAYEFTGEITGFESDGDPVVEVDGSEVDESQLGAESLPNSVVIDGSVSASSSDYEFSVSGDLAALDEQGAIESADTIGDGSASGSVTEDSDAFQFSGDLTSFVIDGTASVTFDDGDS
jgi:hypothetical protein